jgi:N-acetylmuramoyl-L-alanine amidase
MKLIIKSLLLSLSFFISYPVTAEICGIITTRDSSLNIRQSPNQSSPVINNANRGSAVIILDSYDSWYRVLLNNGKTGYGSMLYIKKLSQQDYESCAMIITHNQPLNIRNAPHKHAKMVYKAARGSALMIIDTHGSWYRVLLNNGQIGYANRDYIQELN